MKKTTPWLSLAILVVLSTAAIPQDLQELLDDREREEEEMRRIPGAEIPGIGAETVSDIRLPVGEEIERLRISQDREIDPDVYIVGPGDVLQLYVWGEFDQAIPVSVNPEGYAIVPTIGSFDVSGKTLSQAREIIIAAAQADKYPGVEISVTLVSMRFFTVYLTGAVLTQGAFIVHPIMRLSDLIERGGGFIDELRGSSIEETVAGKKVRRARRFQAQPTARRSLRIIHGDGSVETVDLAMFLATGDVAHNPYLRMGDIVHSPYRTHEVFVYGSVNEEGPQEFVPGDTVGDLINLAGGLAGSAPLAVADIWRFRDDGLTTDVITLVAANPDQAEHYTIDDISHVPLQPKDMLFVRVRSDWQLTPTVHAHGEFTYRGRYRIYAGKTRLRDLVKEAGGYTHDANLVEARVIRTKFKAFQDPELRRLRSIAATSGLGAMNPEERAYLKSKAREERGRLAIDFQRLFEEDDESHNVLLEGGDVVFIPKKRHTVSVSGQMVKPGLVDFEEGRRVAWYLEQTGGYAFDADKGGGRLIRARTGQREPLKKNAVVEPGDEIWVPENEYRDWWSFFQSTVRTLAETLTIAILVRTI